MSTPSPDPQKSEHAYQSSDASDHGLLGRVHACTCAEKPPSDTPPDLRHARLNLDHAPHKLQATPKGGAGACTCHVREEQDGGDLEQCGQGRKMEADDRIEVSPLPPALPPRPPPRPRYEGSLSSRVRVRMATPSHGGIRKYVFWCCACGGLATILGALFLAVYFLLRSYTSTLSYFETIPTFVPATMLILTGICVMSLARRKNRYSYLIKVCGLCCLVCALTCVLVTITTTVIHMNRLQTLRECVYTQKTRTCTCYSVLLEAHSTADDGMRYVFDSTPDCEVIHGALYSCLRAMFGLSVSGILVCIFSCMLVYQLLSHEKKKMYWEQLELRCRSFYQQQSGPPSSNHGSVRGVSLPPSTYCSCCEECRYPPVTTGPQVYPWDNHLPPERFWAPGRIGNFYSPNPEDGPPNNSESHSRTRPLSGWSWRRLPWSRNVGQNDTQRDNSLTYQGNTSSADSQYGFGNRTSAPNNLHDQTTGSTGSYSVLDNRPPVGGVYVWGPPPPYSDPNSPARRPVHQSPGRYHHAAPHLHHHPHTHESHCQMSDSVGAGVSPLRAGTRRPARPLFSNKDNYENTTTTPEVHHPHLHHHHHHGGGGGDGTDSSSCDRGAAHTLPTRRAKKKAEAGSVKGGGGQTGGRAHVQSVFGRGEVGEDGKVDSDHDYHEASIPEPKPISEGHKCRFAPRLQGVENAAFQTQESSPQKPEATESEVYFADVSSCCNISVRNDGQDSSLYDEALDNQKPRLMSLQKGDKDAGTNQILQNFQENISSSTATEDEDYLAHRMGDRQMSVRSRLPFPLPDLDSIPPKDKQSMPPKDKQSAALPRDNQQVAPRDNQQVPPRDNQQVLPRDASMMPKDKDGHQLMLSKDGLQLMMTRDVSGHSLCSVQTPMTESTDDGVSPDECCGGGGYFQERVGGGEQGMRRMEHYLAPDAQYEVIPDQDTYRQPPSNLTATISGLQYDQTYYPQTNFPKMPPPKTLNLQRRNIGSNISALIQNLGGNPPAGLLYGGDEEGQGGQGGCHSDGTMDSGWQSGSERTEGGKQDGEGVNV
ncbi:unnamed protein product [Phaedon cochleariae]|uniref:Uncharacterized protein n=1 Tax=Phaedon cochleariae TaxID=80249 RepID=A0A9P0D9I8_PHACE|nr:unnamed protein product [Phaedon cochleariae]